MSAPMLTTTENSPMQFALSYAHELAKAELLPKPYQRKPAMILVAMEIAKDLGCSVVAVMNGTYEIGGRLSFYTDFMLAQARRSGVIKAVSYESAGEGQKLIVTARAVLAQGEVVEASVSMAEAVAEGWTRNAKYRSMPDQMLRKRAMKRLISNFCPEVLLGSSDDEEDGPAQEQPRAVSALAAKLSPRQVLEGCVAIDAAGPPEPSAEAPLCLPEVESVAAQMPEGTEIHAQGESVRFDVTCQGHRKLVTDVFNAREIPGRWRTLHREKLTERMQSLPDLRATLEGIDAAIAQYLSDNPLETGKA